MRARRGIDSHVRAWRGPELGFPIALSTSKGSLDALADGVRATATFPPALLRALVDIGRKLDALPTPVPLLENGPGTLPMLAGFAIVTMLALLGDEALVCLLRELAFSQRIVTSWLPLLRPFLRVSAHPGESAPSQERNTRFRLVLRGVRSLCRLIVGLIPSPSERCKASRLGECEGRLMAPTIADGQEEPVCATGKKGHADSAYSNDVWKAKGRSHSKGAEP